ncbi:MAG TPA: GGDEF domain-containing protein [Terracidiphilus sp.]|nr:GGDEF domain-containing protein [Terracidiphilus sp.]
MTADNPCILLASHQPALLRQLGSVLLPTRLRVEVVLSTDAALAAMAHAPLALALLDANLPGVDLYQFLAMARLECANRFPIVLIADSARQEYIDRMAERVIDDLILRTKDAGYWQLRIGMIMRNFELTGELEALREAAVKNTELDRLTGVYNRETLLAILARETDRVQRTNSSLSVLLFDIDDFGHWNFRLGSAACDELLRQVAARTFRFLRSYDLIGRPGEDEFLLALPGCSIQDAATLARRLRRDVFCKPFRVTGESIRLSACFGIASSNGRPPVAVLREAEKALARAKKAGPESIQSFDQNSEPDILPVAFLTAGSGDELIAW